MNALIKARAAASTERVRPLGAPFPLERPDMAVLRERIGNLEQELRERCQLVDTLSTARAEAYREGEEAGRQAGLEEAEDRQNERLALLETALSQACGDVAVRLGAIERLAPLIARECLDKMFGESGDRAQIVEDLVRAQMARIDASALLCVEVARVDFGDEAALARLAAQFGSPSPRVEARDDLASGACTMTMRLGRIELGLDQQWRDLSGLLDDMAAPGVAR